MTTIILLTAILGAVVGLSLGLTGGGGAIFAVPFLVYILAVPPRDAVGVSLLTVSCTAFVGLVQRARMGMVEFPTGLLLALVGMIGAPIGTRIADIVPEPLLLMIFAGLMLLIAVRMWLKADNQAAQLPILVEDNAGPTCRRDPEGRLRLTSQCAVLLSFVGLGAGVLAGTFGVGGGFIIVPALVSFARMGIQRAVGTSLLFITLVSISGTASHILSGKALSLQTAAIFTAGSLAGLFLGGWMAQRLAGPTLQRLFSVAILLVAAYVIVRSFQ